MITKIQSQVFIPVHESVRVQQILPPLSKRGTAIRRGTIFSMQFNKVELFLDLVRTSHNAVVLHRIRREACQCLEVVATSLFQAKAKALVEARSALTLFRRRVAIRRIT